MDTKQIIKKIYDAINKSENILLISHRNPDGDTLGSCLALAHYLETLNKNYTVYCSESPAPFFAFMPKFNVLQVSANANIDFKNYDLIIACDCADQSQTGIDEEVWQTITAKIINIDHHASNPSFGDYNLIQPEAASVTAIVYQFFNQNKISLSRDMATCLLTGLVTDTGNFSNHSTNQDALETASRLIAKGAQIRYINYHIIKNKSIPVLKLWSRVFLRLRKNHDLNLAWTVITLKDKIECGVDDLATEGISNIFNELADSSFSLILEEIESGYVKGSLRATSNLIDVSKFAKIMGGGGHCRAAGFRVKGRLVQSHDEWNII